jgi:hypothetical protein
MHRQGSPAALLQDAGSCMQGSVKCFKGEVAADRLQHVSHPGFPSPQSAEWQAAQKRGHMLQYGPAQSALCTAGQEGSLVRQTVKPGAGQTCCRSGAGCEQRAGDYTFFDTT